ncbi:MAG: GNAT family N-acetyltransferase [Rhodospirillales bacterium]
MTLDVKLRLLTVDDVTQRYVDWLNDPEVVRLTEQRHGRHTLESVREFVTDKIPSNDDLYGIFCDGQHVGNIRIGPTDSRYRVASIGYLIGEKDFRGRGVGTKAIAAVIKLAQEHYKLAKIEAEMYANNLASERILLSNGFLLEGVLRCNVVLDGKRMDSKIFGYVIEENLEPMAEATDD